MSALTFVGLFVLAFAGGNGSGWLLGHKRAYAECCECCTCQLCDPADLRLAEAWRDGYEQGCDDELASFAASPASEDAPRALAPAAGDGSRSGGHAEAAPEVHQDWADELSAMHTQIALDDATEVLSAVPDPIPASAWEYRLAEWQATQEKWLDGKRAELAEWGKTRGIELHPVQMEA